MRFILRPLALLLPVILALPASAQNYPNRTVRLIVPFGAGGPADVYARILAQHLSEETKQSFVVEDRPGAGSLIGTDAVAKSAPDGYTLLVMSNTHTTNESLIPNKPYQLMRDFVPVASINYSDLLLVVNPEVPVKSVAELIALAKKDPGKLNYASSGPGTPYHMAGELFKAMSGTDIVHVPHKASGDMRNSVLSGNVQMMFDAITVMSQMAQAGKVRALATSGIKRNPLTPDLPTVGETVPGYESTIWIGLMAPKGTPTDIVAKLADALGKALDDPMVETRYAELGSSAPKPQDRGPGGLQKLVESEVARITPVIKAAGVTAN